METRKITIVETKNQRKSVILSDAATLGELKADLRNNGIDYNGMTFFEGTSKTELKTDDSTLPHDVPYKGQITNELVFMLTNADKNIKSGTAAMSRAEVYNAIKSMGLQDACVKKFGKNFTMCKTTDLITLIQSNGNFTMCKASTSKVEAKKGEKVETPTFEAAAPASNDGGCVDIIARVTISKLVDILEDSGTIEDHEKKAILGILGEVTAIAAAPSNNYKPGYASPYSDDEIDAMFSDTGIN